MRANSRRSGAPLRPWSKSGYSQSKRQNQPQTGQFDRDLGYFEVISAAASTIDLKKTWKSGLTTPITVDIMQVFNRSLTIRSSQVVRRRRLHSARYNPGSIATSKEPKSMTYGRVFQFIDWHGHKKIFASDCGPFLYYIRRSAMTESYLQGYTDRFEFRGYDPDDWDQDDYDRGWEEARSHQYSSDEVMA